MLLPCETIAFGATLLTAVLFDTASIVTMYVEEWWVQFVVYIVFLILQLSCTAWYVLLVFRRSVTLRHVFFIESAQLTELYTACASFVFFALADVSELLEYAVDGHAIVIVFKTIFASSAFVIAFFGLVVTIVARQNHFSRIATSLDAAVVDNLPLIREVSRRAQRRDLSFFIATYWWVVADLVELISYADIDASTTYSITGIVVFIFFVSVMFAVYTDAYLEGKRVELRKFAMQQNI